MHRTVQASLQNRRRSIAAVLSGKAVPKHDLLLQALVLPGDRTNEGALIQVVAPPWFEILECIQSDPNFLYQFTQHPRKFEEFLAGCYRRAGFEDVVLTPPSGDFGIDVIVSATLPGAGVVKIVDQAKAYSPGNSVPANDVRALAGVLQNQPEITKGIITTTSFFAPGVEDEFSRLVPSRVQLKARPELLSWLEELSKGDAE